jgi:alanine racemase
VSRSTFTLDLGAIRDNVRTLRKVAGGAELWAVVKADGYGHGAVDVSRAALDEGATALCVASVAEGLALRESVPSGRLIVLGPTEPDEVGDAREAGLELVVGDAPIPDDVPVHLKLDTGMGRWGTSELVVRGRAVVGLMSHLASAESDVDFTERQIERFRAASSQHPELTRHLANSAGTLGYPEARFDAVRCGIAVYGISPYGDDPAAHGLRPALRWESQLAQVKLLDVGQSTGYGRRFVASRRTWIGLVPVGYADGFRRDMTGAEVLVGSDRCRVLGTVSMDAFAVELPDERPVGEPVTILGDGVLAEEHARVAETIAYEIVCGLRTGKPRAVREVVE